MDDEVWQTISSEAKDFVSKILVSDPQKRLTIEGILEHPWIHKEDCSKTVNPAAKKKIDKYMSVRKSAKNLNEAEEKDDL